MKKRFLTLALAMALCLGLVSPAAAADSHTVSFPLADGRTCQISNVTDESTIHVNPNEVMPSRYEDLPLYTAESGAQVTMPAGYSDSTTVYTFTAYVSELYLAANGDADHSHAYDDDYHNKDLSIEGGGSAVIPDGLYYVIVYRAWSTKGAGGSYSYGFCLRVGDGVNVPDGSGTPFTDVAGTDYFYEAVKWASTSGVTTGTSDSAFSPADPCTRAQVVTFLWRAAGSPLLKDASNPFEDVAVGSYYYDAVLWAVKYGITSGTTATTFSPEAGCTRAQVVTFLWRADEKPSAASQTNPFGDVPADAYYLTAVLWAVENGVTKGTGTGTFSPDTVCTRGQIVTFLWRDIM